MENKEEFDPELNQIFPGYYTTNTGYVSTTKEHASDYIIEEKQHKPNSLSILKEIKQELVNHSLSNRTTLSGIKFIEDNTPYFNIHLGTTNQIFRIYTIEVYNGEKENS